MIKKIMWLLIIILMNCVIAEKVSADIVSCARDKIDKAYLEKYPPDKWTDSCGFFDTDTFAGGTWDCSGLVSYCSNLRRRYITSELEPMVDQINWSKMAPGDLLFHWKDPNNPKDAPNHVMIVEKVVTEKGQHLVYILHAANQDRGVVRDIMTDPNYDGNSWLIRNNYSPYRFKSTTKKAELKFDGAEKGKTYCNDRTINLSATDDVDTPLCPKGKITSPSGTITIDYNNPSKTVSKEGVYSVCANITNWSNNTSQDCTSFEIKRCPRPENLGCGGGVVTESGTEICCESLTKEYTCMSTGDCKAETKSTMSSDPRCRPWNPNPDDNLIVSDIWPLETYGYDASSRVGILTTGYYSLMISYLDRLGIKSRWVDPLSELNDPTLAQRVSVLIVPTAGLALGEDSDIFKSYLETYVRTGGTLIVFAQMEGIDFKVLWEVKPA